MSLWGLLGLVVLGAGAAFAALAALLGHLTRRKASSLVVMLAIVWLPLTAAMSCICFVIADHQAAQVHARNVGMLVMAILMWLAAAIPGLLAGLLIILLWRYLPGRRSS